MERIMETQKKRFEILNYLYKESNGNTGKFFNLYEIGKTFNLGIQETKNIVRYLYNERLIDYTGMGGEISITHKGIVEVENAVSKPDVQSDYFPPLNIINIQNMVNSQIQQGNAESSQSVDFSIANNNDIKDFLELLKTKKSELNLSDVSERELDAEVRTIEAQLDSSRPKKSIIKECFLSIKSILEQSAATLIASGLTNQIPAIVALLN